MHVLSFPRFGNKPQKDSAEQKVLEKRVAQLTYDRFAIRREFLSALGESTLTQVNAFELQQTVQNQPTVLEPTTATALQAILRSLKVALPKLPQPGRMIPPPQEEIEAVERAQRPIQHFISMLDIFVSLAGLDKEAFDAAVYSSPRVRSANTNMIMVEKELRETVQALKGPTKQEATASQGDDDDDAPAESQKQAELYNPITDDD